MTTRTPGSLGAATAEPQLVAVAPAMRALVDRVDRVARSGAPVMITGESGTGKELVARRLHARSPRASGPFVPVNCAALVESLELSELFGHTADAFTGARGRRAGRFESAGEGSILLDEVGETRPGFQATLLRVLQSGEYSPVGSSSTLRCEARVIASTNRDLPRAIREGAFRLDLYHRLAVVLLVVPPLRDRSEDVEALCGHFLARFAERYGVRVPALDAEGVRTLLAHPFPGNVRELENLAHRLVVLYPGEPVGASALAAELVEVADSASADSPRAAAAEELALPFHEAKRRVVERFETLYLRAVIAECDGILRQAAGRAGLSERGLHLKLRQLGLTSVRGRARGADERR
ncbi:MAG TPA: sigma-54 dependent transcriptional regulator [Planctomycetota bacterium]|nr:sigma-54 dependent transcriptional regulator [Planctomycetota bacterium]